LAGVPPLAGFFGKFYVFTAALGAGPEHLNLLWLVVMAVVMSAVSLYYYLLVLKQMYVARPQPGQPRVQAPALVQVTITLAALGVVVLGCLPQFLVARLDEAVKALCR